MTEATLTWSIWQALLNAFACCFTRRGFRRFAEWITAMALNVEEHTITQSVLALEQPGAWKALESFAEYGGWHPDRVTWAMTHLVEKAPGRIWHGYYVSAVDDTKVHRGSPHVWGTCTFHEYTARCPNRAETVRAHNWVVLGPLLQESEKPGWFLPISGRLYFRASQLPADPTGLLVFRTKCELAVELLREQARIVPGHKHLGVFDGGYALGSVVRPLVLPEDGGRRIDFLTRLRHDARLFALPPTDRPAGTRGPKPKWGRRLEPPRRGGRWEREGRTGSAFIYGRQRKVRWKEVVGPISDSAALSIAETAARPILVRNAVIRSFVSSSCSREGDHRSGSAPGPCSRRGDKNVCLLVLFSRGRSPERQRFTSLFAAR